MSASTDRALAALPERYRVERSPGRTIVFAAVLVALVIALVLQIVFFEQIQASSLEDTGRRSGLRAIAAPGMIVVTAGFIVLFAVLLLRQSHRWVDAVSGARLAGRFRNIEGDASVAQAWHAAFATDAPATYAQLSSADRGDIRIAVYLDAPARTAHVTVTRSRKGEDYGLAPVVVTGADFTRLNRLVRHNSGGGPAAGSTLDPLLRD